MARRRSARLGAYALAGLIAILAFAAPTPVAAQDLRSFEERTTVHKLANGWTFILVRRPVSPVFAFDTLADVGPVQEVLGITGLAHMFEHMAFKGSQNIGSTNYPAESQAIERMEEAYQALQSQRLADRPDPARQKELEAEFKKRQQEAASFVVKDEFDEILSRAGAVGINASTGADETNYYYSLPSNKAELFAYLESERFYQPVLRQFYEERDVVKEERRQRTDSSPLGKLVGQFLAAAFSAHPYHMPSIGYMSDLDSITITDARAFFRDHYAPSNMTTAIVGDIDPKTLIPLLETYFGRIPGRPTAPPLRTVEPPQGAEKTVVIEEAAQPYFIEGYHKPADSDPDQAAWVALDDILLQGRTSRLYRALVRDQKLAIQVDSLLGFPGSKYPNLWGVLVTPGMGVSHDQIKAALHGELGRLLTEDVKPEELARAKARARAGLIRTLQSNRGLAQTLVEFQRRSGDWRELFRFLDRLDQVTAADIRRVANQALVPNNRTVAMLVTQKPAAPEH
jgi:predicted Zn-dependent peptidase